MWKLFVVTCLFFAGSEIRAADNTSNTKVVCHYDSKAFSNEGLGKVTLTDIEAGLSQCTHLVYGWAGINDNKKVVSLNSNQDLDQGKGFYRLTTQLKRKFPGLKVLLGIGGDSQREYDKWLNLLESSTSRISFINSAYDLVKSYDFDGIDLAFEFPKIKVKKERSGLGSVWYGFQKTIGVAGNPVDEKSEEHKEEFTALIRELKNSFRPDGYLLSVTILPNVNSSLYLDIPATHNNIDFLTLGAYDVQDPERYKKKADYPAPLYALGERDPELNINYQVTNLIGSGFPANKIIIGIPTFGRTWTHEEGATATGVPPVVATGPGPEGLQTKKEGLLGYAEICQKLTNPQNKDLKGENAPLKKVGDPSKRYGSYAYRLPDSSGANGLWVGYEDPETAGNKAAYARAKNLGGVAIFDLTLDDFRGACSGDKFPILRSARNRLM